MQMTTALLMANPCDDEEDNLAMLCCHSDKGEMFLITRYPDEAEVEITLDDKSSTLEGLKITLSPTRLLLEVAPSDTDALNNSDHLEIIHSTDADELAQIEQALKNILTGTGTYISELS